jgi:Holliday junction resolvase
MAANYHRGARLERLARKTLEQNGYAVIRSAGSKGAVDLAAFSAKRVLLVQVKAGRVTPADVRKLKAFPAPPGAVKQFWQRDGKGWKVSEVEEGWFHINVEPTGGEQ